MQNALFWLVAVAAFWFFPDEMDLGGLVLDVTLFIGGVIVATPFLVYFAVVRGLPEDVRPEEAPESEITSDMENVIGAYLSSGFERFGPPLRFSLGQEAILVPLVDRANKTFGTVYTVGKKREKVHYDVVSTWEGVDGGLTTAMDGGAGVLPRERGSYLQVFDAASPGGLIHNHGLAVQWVESCGLQAADADPDEFVRLVRKSIHTSRRVFMRNKATNTLRALWRTLTKKNPFLEPLPHQAGIEAEVRGLASVAAANRQPGELVGAGT